MKILGAVSLVLFSACYFPVRLKKEIPIPYTNYQIFVRQDMNHEKYAILNDSSSIHQLRKKLRLKANFGMKSNYYCYGGKYFDGLIVAENNYFKTGECLNNLKYLNLDSLHLNFKYTESHVIGRKREVDSIASILNAQMIPFFIAQHFPSDYYVLKWFKID